MYLILGAYSRNHIFRKGNLPDWQRISDGIIDLWNRIRWRSILCVDNAPIPWWRRRPKGGRVAHCDKIAPPEINVFNLILIRQLKQCAAVAIRQAAIRNKWWRTLPAAFCHFKSWMRKYGLQAVPTDKYGGYMQLYARNI